MSDWPRMLYRHRDGADPIHGVPVDTLIVDSWQEAEAAHHDGWRRTPVEAGDARLDPPKRRPGRPRKNPLAPEPQST